MPSIPDDELPQPDPPTEVDVSAFRGGQEACETDIFIAVMGVTGAGKSTLISHLALDGVGPQIGKSLASCTQACAVYQVAYSTNRNVYLVDTPGFDDTERTDAEVLSLLANWLAITYSNQTKLHGILYLHRITDVRMQGSARRNLKVFRDLCGQDALSKVVLVTTMWEKLSSQEEGEEREVELKTTGAFWGYMVKKGSKLERYTNDMQSAKRLVDMFLPANDDTIPEIATLAIQEEMTVQKKSLADTAAGEIVRDDIAAETARIAKQMEECRDEIRDALQQRDDERRQEAQELLAEMEASNAKIHDRYETLRKDMVEMIKNTYEQALFSAEREDDEKSQRISDQYSIRSGTSSAVCSHRSLNLFSSLPEVVRSSSFITSRSTVLPLYPLEFRRVNQPLSLSLRGRHCSFIGLEYEKSYLPESTRNSLVNLQKSTRAKTKIKCLVLGEGMSYYTHYHEGSIFSRCYYHGAIRQHYPQLWSFLSQQNNTRCPDSISLGTEGSYFINVAGSKSLQWHPMSRLTVPLAKIKRLWWGYQGSYVVELDDEKVQMDLRGFYNGLGLLLPSKGHEIKDLALNIVDGSSFVVILNNQQAYYSGTDDIMRNCFEEYALRHSVVGRRGSGI